ncbi:Macro domain-containing protein [Emericellopsis cladophorae]|uniref:Macro domain-containing protein n=1 Tax=Emericellopsis cladophorae TaxID=2686198 RepID=A0A9P9Y3E6_9HYPO|nr:Macro domain-containing protein [Emericellopsis cladophorae]KAI6782757.1 Macro domain-containing protein [Emericellopsis cladophorae]
MSRHGDEVDLPTVTDLYNRGDLEPSDKPRKPYSESINARVSLIEGDITALPVDAIVNAANSSLLGGGGVDGAIHAAAGPRLLAECKTLQGCQPGEAKITKGYELPAAHVIHTVGPVYFRTSTFQAKQTLESCYEECLRVAVNNGVRTLAFCAISTGVYGYPQDDAAQVACEQVRKFIETEDGQQLDSVIFTTFTTPDVEAYDKAVPQFFPPA